jgi:uncharacterized membrane protein YgcG
VRAQSLRRRLLSCDLANKHREPKGAPALGDDPLADNDHVLALTSTLNCHDATARLPAAEQRILRAVRACGSHLRAFICTHALASGAPKRSYLSATQSHTCCAGGVILPYQLSYRALRAHASQNGAQQTAGGTRCSGASTAGGSGGGGGGGAAAAVPALRRLC